MSTKFNLQSYRSYLYLRSVANGDMKRKDISSGKAHFVLSVLSREDIADHDKDRLATIKSLPDMVKCASSLVHIYKGK